MYLRYATASQEICLGRFVDSTDGNTEETGLTINNTDIKLHKHGATTLADKNSGGGTHISNGVYYAVLDDTDTNTLGNLEVHVHVSGALSVSRAYTVLPAKVFDSLVLGTDNLEVDAIQLSGDTTAADNAESFFDGTGYAGTNNIIPTVTAVTNEVTANITKISGDTTAADNAESFFDGTGYAGTGNIIPTVTTVNGLGNDVITAASIATGAIDADALADGASQELIELMFTYDATATYGTAHAGSLVKQIADNAGGSSLTLGDIADAVWDEAMAGHTTAGTTGKKLDDAGTAGDPWSTALPGAYGAGTAGKIVGDNLNAPVGTVDTVVDAIKAKTDNLPASPAATGDIPSAASVADAVWDEVLDTFHEVAGSSSVLLQSAGTAADPWSTALPGAYGAGTAGKILGDNLNAPVGTVDTVVDAIKAKTDNLPASPAATGDIPSAATIRAEIDSNSTQLAAIVADTNELQTDMVNGGRVDLLIDGIKAKTDLIPASPAAVSDIPTAAVVRAEIDSNSTQLAAIVADTNELQVDITNGGRIDLLIDGIKAKTDLIPASPAAVSDIPTAVAIRTEIDANSTQLAAIVADTNEVQTDLTNGGRLDLLVDAIKAKTDLLPASPVDVSDIPVLADIVDGVWNEAKADHTTIGSTGEAIGLIAAPSSVPTVEQIRNEMDSNSTQLAAIKAKTDTLPAAPAAVTDIPSLVQIADAVWEEDLSGHATGGSTGEALTTAAAPGTPELTAIEVVTLMDAASSQLAGIRAKTDNIPASALTASDVDVLLTANHGVGSWASVPASVGAYLITITVKENDGVTPIPDVRVGLYNSTLTVLLDSKTTSALGQVIFQADAGTYKAMCRKAQTSFAVNPTTLTVVDAAITQTITGVSLTIALPADPEVCRVYEILTNQDGITHPTTVTSTAEIVSLPYDYSGQIYPGSQITPVYTPATGVIYWDIIAGATIGIGITDFFPFYTVQVPEDEASARLMDLF